MRKYLTNKNIIISSLILIMLVLIIILIFFNPFIYFKVNGLKNITVNVNDNYSLPQVNAYIFNNDITNKIEKSGKVNIKKIGEYKITYKVKYFFTTKTLYITLNVVDNELPNIVLNGNENISICPNLEYIEEGYNATDNYDGDITDKVKKEVYDTYIEYKVKDSSNNKFSIKRNIIKEDKESPIITLNGYSTYKITLGSNFSDKGYSASDNCDGDISSNVEVINNLNTNKLGIYDIIYKVKDISGNEAIVTRKVEVINNNKSNDYSNIIEGPTYINGILIVNKKYSIPKSFGGTNSEANNALYSLQNAASLSGFSLPLVSGYRSYSRQQTIYNNYVSRYGQSSADTFSARPGHSEHQTGLAFDVGRIDDNFGDTPVGMWLKDNAHYYGFIIRYPKGKENITGYKYEPWHVRYVGVGVATDIYNRGITLEEYLGV